METLYLYKFYYTTSEILIFRFVVEEAKKEFFNEKQGISVKKSDLDDVNLHNASMYSLNGDVEHFKEKYRKALEKNIRYWQKEIREREKIVKYNKEIIKELDSVKMERIR